MSDTLIALVIHEARAALKADATLPENVAAAMKAAANHWTVLDFEPQFKGAIAALATHYGEGSPEYERIIYEARMLGKFNAMIVAAQAGLSVGLDSLVDDDEPKPEPVGLMQAFRDARTAAGNAR
jgi:hypothetical protein